MDRVSLKARLASEEAERLVAYRDSLGILTVGIGHNCQSKPVEGVTKPGDYISPELEQQLFDSDVDDAVAELDKYLPWWSQLDDARQNVMVDLCFNMGIGTLRTFVHTLSLIEEGAYGAAANGMAHSLWARQVGTRAEFLEAAMRSGVYA